MYHENGLFISLSIGTVRNKSAVMPRLLLTCVCTKCIDAAAKAGRPPRGAWRAPRTKAAAKLRRQGPTHLGPCNACRQTIYQQPSEVVTRKPEEQNNRFVAHVPIDSEINSPFRDTCSLFCEINSRITHLQSPASQKCPRVYWGRQGARVVAAHGGHSVSHSALRHSAA